MNLSIEGLMGLTGTVCIMAGFPVLMFGDYFDPSKKLTPAGLLAGFVTGFGLLCVLTAFSVISTRILWTAVAGH